MIRLLFQKSASKRIVSSFALIILIGSILLTLPFGQLPTSQATYFDHLFTAVSMVCVTGLSTQAVAQTYNIFGQFICMLLMQIGGLGLMSLIAFIIFNMGKKFSLVDRLALQESLNREDTTNFRFFVSTIFKFTLAVEGIATFFLSFKFIPLFGWKRGIFNALFLSISAFCNAGFDNLGDNSLQNYMLDPLINSVIIILIIVGGLGFSVWFDLKNTIKKYYHQLLRGQFKFIYRKLKFHTRIVLLITLVILLLGTITTLITEFHNPATIGTLSIPEKIVVSLFQTVTMRTAGFSTIDYTVANPSTLLLYMVQMFIGGSPGGTAGGVKTTTFLIVILFLINEVKNEPYINFKYRTFSDNLISKAASIFFIFSTAFFIGLFALSITDPDISFLHLLFETISALATVGVTANVTTNLSFAGRIIIMLLMFIGRTGPITALLSLSLRKKKDKSIHYADSTLLVG